MTLLKIIGGLIMKRKIITIGFILLVCIAIPFTAFAMSSARKYDKNITLGDTVLVFDKVEGYNVSAAFFIDDDMDRMEDRVKYTDNSDNTYVYLNGEIIAYWSTNLGVFPINEKKVSKEECLYALNSELSALIRGYEDYKIIGFDDSHGGYRILMNNMISQYAQDTLTVQVNCEGSIDWFVADYCNLTGVSNAQLKAADEKLENYLSTYKEDFISFEYNLHFRLKGKEIISTYVITFTDPGGYCFSDVVSFVVETLD